MNRAFTYIQSITGFFFCFFMVLLFFTLIFMMCGYKYGGVTCLFSQSFDMVQEFSHGKSNDSAAGDDKNEGDMFV